MQPCIATQHFTATAHPEYSSTRHLVLQTVGHGAGHVPLLCSNACHASHIACDSTMTITRAHDCRQGKHHGCELKSCACRFRLGDHPPAPKRNFRNFWHIRCESAWRKAFYMFTTGGVRSPAQLCCACCSRTCMQHAWRLAWLVRSFYPIKVMSDCLVSAVTIADIGRLGLDSCSTLRSIVYLACIDHSRAFSEVMCGMQW